MKNRLVFFLLVLLLLPMAVAVWMGVRSLEEGQATALNQVRSIWIGRLSEIRDKIRVFAQKWEERFRTARDGDLLVRQTFQMKEGKIISPTRFDQNGMENEFFVRTDSIWDDRFWDRAPKEKIQPADSGWKTWVRGQAPSFLYWVRAGRGEIRGVELDSWAFLSRLSAELPELDWNREDAANQTILVKDAAGKIFQRWGHWEQGDEPPILSIALEAPFDGWEIRFYMNPERLPAFSSEVLGLYIFAGLGLVLILALGTFLLIRSLRASLKEASQRVNFVNQVSHELKTPLTNILLYGELLEKALGEVKTAKKTQEYLEVIRTESGRLGRLIHNVLTFARRERGDQPHLRSSSWNPLIEMALKPFFPGFKDRNIQLEFRPEAEVGEGSWDPDWVGQIVGNLVGNAEKYAASGGWVGVETGGDETTVWVRVKDRGPGIPTSYREKIFLPFVRLEDRLTSSAAGAGLGLTIARDRAHQHGGRLELETATSGASFLLTLPRHEGQKL